MTSTDTPTMQNNLARQSDASLERASGATGLDPVAGVGGLEAWPAGLRSKLIRALTVLAIILGMTVLADALIP
jgi:hypothetical protein